MSRMAATDIANEGANFRAILLGIGLFERATIAETDAVLNQCPETIRLVRISGRKVSIREQW